MDENRKIPAIFDMPAGCAQTLPQEVEGAIALGCIRPELLTADQVHQIAWFAKMRLEADRTPEKSMRHG